MNALHATVKLNKDLPAALLNYSWNNQEYSTIHYSADYFPIILYYFYVYKMLEIGKNVHHNEPVSGNVLRHVCSVQ